LSAAITSEGLPHSGSLKRKVDVFGHDYVAYDGEVMALANLFQDFEEEIAVVRRALKRPTLETTGGDEAEVSGTVIAVKIGGHSRVVARRAGVQL
jgi:hypothetical protein